MCLDISYARYFASLEHWCKKYPHSAGDVCIIQNLPKNKLSHHTDHGLWLSTAISPGHQLCSKMQGNNTHCSLVPTSTTMEKPLPQT